MAKSASVVCGCSVVAIGAGQNALIAEEEIVDSRHVFALLTITGIRRADHTAGVTGLTAKIRDDFILPC